MTRPILCGGSTELIQIYDDDEGGCQFLHSGQTTL